MAVACSADDECGPGKRCVQGTCTWETRAEEWYEIPGVTIYEDGTPIRTFDQTCGKAPFARERTRKSGRRVVGFRASGRIELVFEIEPSGHCNNGDHDDTFFWLDNLNVRVY